MRLLLTNDDGIGSEGISVLAGRLSEKHEVWIVAPDSNRSGVSHCITMKNSMKLVKTGKRKYKYSGTPADCVITGLRSGLIPEDPDVVISGINRGANIGTDILYSGTAAAARQAVLYGIPGIALSIDSSDGRWEYDALADFTEKNLVLLKNLCSTAGYNGSMPATPCVFVNVNALSALSYKGVRCTDVSFREYHDTIQLRNVSGEVCYSSFRGGSIVSGSRQPGDYEAVCDGYISVSRIYAEPVSAGIVDGLVFSL
jgi:5'-nucleotidase